MGYELINEKNERLSITIWWFPEILELARNFGWQPIGTVMSDGMAEELAEASKNVSPSWNYIFWFMQNDGLCRSGHIYSSNNRLSDEDIAEIKNDPERYWDMSEDIFGYSYHQPYECLKVDIEPPKPNLVMTADDVKKQWKGGYCSNDGQVILVEDCLNLANALHRAVKQKTALHYDELKKVIDFFSKGNVYIY